MTFFLAAGLLPGFRLWHVDRNLFSFPAHTTHLPINQFSVDLVEAIAAFSWQHARDVSCKVVSRSLHVLVVATVDLGFNSRVSISPSSPKSKKPSAVNLSLGRPAGKVGQGLPNSGNSRSSLRAAASIGMPVTWKEKGKSTSLPFSR